MTMKSITWLIPVIALILIVAATFLVILPAYTVLLAVITILRAKWQSRDNNNGKIISNGGSTETKTGASSPYSHVATSFYQGVVFHIRHQPTVHSFKYPLYFSVVDLDEASELFGEGNVYPQFEEKQQQHLSKSNPKGSLWPLSSLMLLKDADHLKNGEGMIKHGELQNGNVSMRERLFNLIHERTNGKMDLRSTVNDDNQRNTERRKILLVTHLMYYGYCFNPVSFYFVMKPTSTAKNDDDEVEAIVIEISNTPWNEMSVYVLHPDSVDITEHSVYPSMNSTKNIHAKTYQYRWSKNFHVSPFMTMDHDYDWTFQVSRNRIKAEVKLFKHKKEDSSSKKEEASDNNNMTNNGIGAKKENNGLLYFTGGFDIQRTIQPTSTYPLQLAKVIFRFPIYCFLIQLWIHYQAFWLLMKGVEFIPHPEGSETGASRAIAAVMKPVFAAMDVVDVWWSRWKGDGKSKTV